MNSDGAFAGIGPTAQQAETDRQIALPAGIWMISKGTEHVRELATFLEYFSMSVLPMQFDNDSHIGEIYDEEPGDTFGQSVRNSRS